MREHLKAVIWDFDGTLVDSRHKNLAVTLRILREVTGRSWEDWPSLGSVASYQEAVMRSSNWRDLYRDEFLLNEADTERAGALWTTYQMDDPTPVPLFDGIAETLGALETLPQGIVSQNCRKNIRKTLAESRLDARFEWIVGYEEVPSHCQKPHPHGLLTCVEQLTGGKRDGCVVYIGDHETDMCCAHATRKSLKERGSALEVITIGALYGTSRDAEGWSFQPDFRAAHPSRIVEIVRELNA